MRMLHMFIALWLVAVSEARSDVVKYTSKSQWQSLVGAHTTITFTELPYPPTEYTTTQYEYLGVTFSDGNDVVLMANSFVNDTLGLYGNLPGDSITVLFTESITSFSVDHPGDVGLKLYSGDELIFDTGMMGGAGTGFFSGVISDIAFDKVVIKDPLGGTYIDDMHFGPPIPAPSGLALIGVALIARSRRRRCS